MTTQNIKNQIVTELKNYCQKHGFKDVVIGLSGGLDSAVVLALSCEALGSDHVHTIMMKTKYTSDNSINLAQEAADVNNVEHRVLDIQNSVDAIMSTLDFDSKVPVTEQNIQARVRGVISMAYSNEKGWFLLSCGNKSELAMGYCTLYGDMCGGLSPIGDVYKTEAYDIANLCNQEGKVFVPQGIIDRTPTAELAPNQKDTDSLPPYEVLDKILQNNIYGNEAPKTDIEIDIKRKFDNSFFKRLQSAPSIEVKR